MKANLVRIVSSLRIVMVRNYISVVSHLLASQKILSITVQPVAMFNIKAYLYTHIYLHICSKFPKAPEQCCSHLHISSQESRETS